MFLKLRIHSLIDQNYLVTEEFNTSITYANILKINIIRSNKIVTISSRGNLLGTCK